MKWAKALSLALLPFVAVAAEPSPPSISAAAQAVFQAPTVEQLSAPRARWRLRLGDDGDFSTIQRSAALSQPYVDLMKLDSQGALQAVQFCLGLTKPSCITQWPTVKELGWARDAAKGSVILETLTDRVGVGTAAPTQKLHVVGNFKLEGALSCAGCVSVAALADGAVVSEKIAAAAVNSTKIVDGSIDAVDVNANQVQLRIASECPAKSAIRAVGVDGTPSCQPLEISIDPTGWVDDGPVVRLQSPLDLVGLGVSLPQTKLHVRASDSGLAKTVSAADAITGECNVTACAGLNGLSGASKGIGVFAMANAADAQGLFARSNLGTAILSVTASGALFLGQAPAGTNQVRIDSNGTGFFNGGTEVGGADFAEAMPAREPESLEPGDVLVLDGHSPGYVKKSDRDNSRHVIGVYSLKPGVLATEGNPLDAHAKLGRVPVAITGIVPVKVTTENGPIAVGDLLTTSSTPGYAMKAVPVVFDGYEVFPTGTILGKALEPWSNGRGVIRALIVLR